MRANKAESVSKSGRRRILNKVKKTKNTDDSGAATSRKKLRIDVAPEESKPVDHSVALAIARDENKCIYCFGITNRQGHSEQLLVCKDCNARVHPSCADMTEELATRASSCPWQCIDCKTCNVCNDSGDAEDMLICDSCDKGFHMNCHNPTVPEKPTGKWVCCQCVIEQGENNTLEESKTDVASDERKEAASGNDLAELTCLPTPGASPVHVQTENTQNEATSSKTSTVRPPARVLPKLSDTLIGEPPDASDWSPVDVAAFFHNLGFTEESSAFQNQEIDGKAVLLMTRNDVLTGLEFKLGPALKIYAHIQRLQTRDHWLTVHK